MKSLGEEIKKIEAELAAVTEKHRELWLAIPNLTHPDVKVSADENDNPVVGTFLEPKKFDFPALDHVELALKSDLIDLERAAKVSGANFTTLKTNWSRLNSRLSATPWISP
jgi:seryl-tRNA synthetase